MRAGDFYWRMMYGRGRTVFYGWLDTIRASRDSMKSILAGGKWKSDSKGCSGYQGNLRVLQAKVGLWEVFNKKLSQKQRRALAVSQ